MLNSFFTGSDKRDSRHSFTGNSIHSADASKKRLALSKGSLTLLHAMLKKQDSRSSVSSRSCHGVEREEVKVKPPVVTWKRDHPNSKPGGGCNILLHSDYGSTRTPAHSKQRHLYAKTKKKLGYGKENTTLNGNVCNHSLENIGSRRLPLISLGASPGGARRPQSLSDIRSEKQSKSLSPSSQIKLNCCHGSSGTGLQSPDMEYQFANTLYEDSAAPGPSTTSSSNNNHDYVNITDEMICHLQRQQTDETSLDASSPAADEGNHDLISLAPEEEPVKTGKNERTQQHQQNCANRAAGGNSHVGCKDSCVSPQQRFSLDIDHYVNDITIPAVGATCFPIIIPQIHIHAASSITYLNDNSLYIADNTVNEHVETDTRGQEQLHCEKANGDTTIQNKYRNECDPQPESHTSVVDSSEDTPEVIEANVIVNRNAVMEDNIAAADPDDEAEKHHLIPQKTKTNNVNSGGIDSPLLKRNGTNVC